MELRLPEDSRLLGVQQENYAALFLRFCSLNEARGENTQRRCQIREAETDRLKRTPIRTGCLNWRNPNNLSELQ